MLLGAATLLVPGLVPGVAPWGAASHTPLLKAGAGSTLPGASSARVLLQGRGLSATLSGEWGVRGLARTLPASSAAAWPCAGAGAGEDGTELALALPGGRWAGGGMATAAAAAKLLLGRTGEGEVPPPRGTRMLYISCIIDGGCAAGSLPAGDAAAEECKLLLLPPPPPGSCCSARARVLPVNMGTCPGPSTCTLRLPGETAVTAAALPPGCWGRGLSSWFMSAARRKSWSRELRRWLLPGVPRPPL